jgi:hypothetical protein
MSNTMPNLPKFPPSVFSLQVRRLNARWLIFYPSFVPHFQPISSSVQPTVCLDPFTICYRYRELQNKEFITSTVKVAFDVFPLENKTLARRRNV